jgi:hypothetical protein
MVLSEMSWKEKTMGVKVRKRNGKGVFGEMDQAVRGG